MTLKDLEQIVYIKRETEVLSSRLKSVAGGRLTGDYAKDYSTGFERIITIHGYAQADVAKAQKLSALLNKRKKELDQKILDAELFIDSIPDSKIRTLLTLRYLEGRRWNDVAKHFYKMKPDAARKAVERFFKNCS